ncbi:hypothetical protein [Mesorhizobium sp. M0058]|uniref:hypothetical protein n=1 Tax=Mesorhizobium sp. M0058 TaxID=2956865 RepID=UPI00333997AE
MEDSENSGLTLDAIFRKSYGLWGGRFHLIVPCADGKPIPAFTPWLTAYDPDIVYSFCDLTNQAIEEIHETIYPSYLTRHESRGDDKTSIRYFTPDLKFSPLSSETLVPYVTIPIRYRQGDRAVIIDSYYGSASDDAFILQNFGGFTGSIGRSYPASLSEFGAPFHILSDTELQPRRRHGLNNLNVIQNRYDLLKEMSKNDIVSVSRLASLATPRLDIPNSRWADAFNIVVGDSFVDRVTFWNARSLYPRWRDGRSVDLIIPEKDLDDYKLLSSIGEFILNRNNVNSNQSSSTPEAIIRSSSVSKDRLQALTEKLKAGSEWVRYQVSPFEAIEDHIPSKKSLDRSYFAFVDGIGAGNRKNWRESEANGREISIQAPKPDHLQHMPPALVSSHSGSWAVELEISRTNDLSKYQNEQQNWWLPRRLRTAPAFRGGYQLAGNGPIVMPRVSCGGFLCLFADAQTDITNVSVPSDEKAIRAGYTSGRNWWPFVEKHDGTAQMPNQLAFDVRRSGNGRYFWGVLEMFGGLDAIKQTLLHGFWREQFELLGASSSRTESRRESVINILKQRLRKKLDSPISDGLDMIADRVLEEAEQFRSRPPSVAWTDLASAHGRFVERYWELHPPRADESGMAGWRDDLLASLEPSVQRLCQMGVLHQGYETKCRKCLHKFWISIEALKATITCEVCHTTVPAPVGRPWAFRLNEFFREALRAHGVLPLFWALEKSRTMQERSFYFEGPLDIYFSESSADRQEPDTDIDLTTISNGVVQIFEVKQSARQMQKAIEFADIAKRIRPDIATIAVMEPRSAYIENKFSEYAQALSGSGVEARLLTLESGSDFSENPSLDQMISMRIF